MKPIFPAIQSSSLTVFNRENANLSSFDASLGKEVDLQPRENKKGFETIENFALAYSDLVGIVIV